MIVAIAAGVVPFLVWLPSFRFQYDHNLYAYNGSFNVRAVAYAFARIIGLLGETGAFAALVRLLFALGVVAGALLLARRRETELAGLLTVVPVALTALVWLFGPHIFNERNLLVSAPFAAVSAGALVSAAPRRASILAAAALAAAVGFSLWRYEVDYGRSAYDGIAHALVAEGWEPGDELVQFGSAPLGLSEPVGWYLPGRPHLVGTRATPCDRLFAVSYDTGAGRRWIRDHLAPGAQPQLFTAYDHTPRGPKAATPITVARVQAVRLPGGARLLHAAGSHCP